MGRQTRQPLAVYLSVACLLTAVAIGGCAAAQGPATARLSLEQIQPSVALPPASRPSADQPDEAPLEAVVLYAQARLELTDGHRAAAAKYLQKAVTLDPNSYELHYALGKALRNGVEFEGPALAQFEIAAAIEPDRLDVQLDLGKQWLAKGDNSQALTRFRLAILTSDYHHGDERCAEADFLLAYALRELGYDKAAAGRLELLVARLERGEIGHDDEEESADPLPVRLYLQLGDIYIRLGRAGDSLVAFRKAETLTGRKLDRTDPSLLDRLGDVLYRLEDRDGAGRAWNRALQRLAQDEESDEPRVDRSVLRSTVTRKLQRLRSGEPVEISSAVR